MLPKIYGNILQKLLEFCAEGSVDFDTAAVHNTPPFELITSWYLYSRRSLSLFSSNIQVIDSATMLQLKAICRIQSNLVRSVNLTLSESIPASGACPWMYVVLLLIFFDRLICSINGFDCRWIFSHCGSIVNPGLPLGSGVCNYTEPVYLRLARRLILYLCW